MATFSRQQRLEQLDRHFEYQRIRIERETETSMTTTTTGATLPGDALRMRGVPIQGKGVAGHIPGTRP